jgi:DNA repair protein RecN (Recombination protein N)
LPGEHVLINCSSNQGNSKFNPAGAGQNSNPKLLKRLSIQNYAIIDEITIDFSSQLNIITGETGAGKSILMGALSLILGERADSSVLVNREKKCFIEGIFTVDHKQAVLDFLEQNDLDKEPELVLRREIAANGKSRAFINDTPATLQQLKALASLLVDLHQQFDTLELGDSDFQREVLDALAGNEKNISTYRTQYHQWQALGKELAELQQQKLAFNKELDYNRFLFDELEAVSLKENELEELDAELKLLSNAESIKTGLSKVYFDLRESEQPVVQTLKQMQQQLQSFASYHPSMADILQRLQASQIELQDIAGEIESINDSVNYDEKRIEWINQRLADGYKLMKKHGVTNTNELVQLQQELEQKLREVLDMDDTIAAKEKELAQLFATADKQAGVLSKARHAVARPLEEKVNHLLAQVGMPNAKLKVSLADTALSNTGKDAIEFLFDANKSNRFEPIRKVASGGELSRLMLCIKSLVAQSVDLPTMIFDEIDTGISGEAARQVGLIMKGLSTNRQIICITHQPQIAGKANAHFFVYKEIQGNAVKTNIRLLQKDERINAIARMLSGERPTAAALENAREMMN